MRALPVAALVLGLCTLELEAGTVTGQVLIEESQRAQRPPRYYLGPYRGTAGGRVGGGAPNVVVYVGDTFPDSTFVPPTSQSLVRQRQQQFIPHVLPVLKGTSVGFPNLDNYYHNVFSVLAGERFDLGRYGAGESSEQTFNQPGVVVLRCEIHPGMKSYVLVLENPFFAVPDSTGHFSIEGIPGGIYNLKAWHPKRGERMRRAVVPESGVIEVRFSY